MSAWEHRIVTPLPAWALHHRMQHEAEHRGQIVAMRKLYHQLVNG